MCVAYPQVDADVEQRSLLPVRLHDDAGEPTNECTDDEREELRALLNAPSAPVDEPPADTPKGLAPDDPVRIALSDRFRDLKLRSLTL